MAILVSYDSPAISTPPPPNALLTTPAIPPTTTITTTTTSSSSPLSSSNLEVPSRVPDLLARLLSAYPLSTSLSSHLDLNDLDHLSRTSRTLRMILVPQRQSLISKSLQCEIRYRRGCVRDRVQRCFLCARAACRNCLWKDRTYGRNWLVEKVRRGCGECGGRGRLKSGADCSCALDIWVCASCTILPSRRCGSEEIEAV